MVLVDMKDKDLVAHLDEGQSQQRAFFKQERALSLALAGLSERGIERPLLRWRREGRLSNALLLRAGGAAMVLGMAASAFVFATPDIWKQTVVHRQRADWDPRADAVFPGCRVEQRESANHIGLDEFGRTVD